MELKLKLPTCPKTPQDHKFMKDYMTLVYSFSVLNTYGKFHFYLSQPCIALCSDYNTRSFSLKYSEIGNNHPNAFQILLIIFYPALF